MLNKLLLMPLIKSRPLLRKTRKSETKEKARKTIKIDH